MNLSSINPLALPSLPVEKRSQLPGVAGIYFVLNKTKQVQYIGRSVNIRRRWSGHHQLAKLKNIDSSIAWLEVLGSAKIRCEIESALIDLYKPPLNRTSRVATKKSCSKTSKFSKAFKEVMFRYRLSAAKLADTSGLTTAQISRFRNGGNLRIDSLEKLLRALPAEAYNDFFKLLKSSF